MKQTASAAIARWFLVRAVVLTLAFILSLAVIGSLFENSSDADFGPAHSGALFSLYHSVLGAILFVLLAPMWLLEQIQRLTGFGLMDRDWLCSVFSSACYGVMLSCIWYFRSRHRLHAKPRAQQMTPHSPL